LKGDSGGPLVCGGIHTGVVSGGPDQCATLNDPGTYARTSAYVAWIRNIIDNEEMP
jgi:secreted trypsin-like serine protease